MAQIIATLAYAKLVHILQASIEIRNASETGPVTKSKCKQPISVNLGEDINTTYKLLQKTTVQGKVVNAKSCVVGDDEKPSFKWFVDGKEYTKKENKTSFGWVSEESRRDMNGAGSWNLELVVNFLGQEHRDNITVTVTPDADTVKFVKGKFQTIELGNPVVFELKTEGESPLNVTCNGGTFESCFGVEFSADTEISTKSLTLDEQYQVEICKSSAACAVQTIEIKEGFFPEVDIRCVENCQDLYNPNKPGKFVVECKNCADGEEVEATVLSKIGNLDNPGMVKFDAGYFTPGTIVDISGEIKLENGNSAKNEIQIEVNVPPSNGTCSTVDVNQDYRNVKY